MYLVASSAADIDAGLDAQTFDLEAIAAGMVCTIVDIDGRRGFVLGWTSGLGGVFVHGCYVDDTGEDFEAPADEVTP